MGTELVSVGKNLGITTENVPSVSGHVKCSICLKKSNLLRADSKKGSKNPMWVGGQKHHKRQYKGLSLEERKALASIRMKLNNPMKNVETRKKVTLKMMELKKTGVITYKRGINHHLWRGNRKRSQVIRSSLYRSWIYPILNRDNFTCRACNKTKCRLEVHHDEIPYRDVLDTVLNGKILNDLSLEEFQKIMDEVVNYHLTKPVSGITLCKECHKKLDPLRK